jgi:biopolymer transport protein ExbD
MGAKLSSGGGGKFGLGQNAEINVTPFVDVMLVLLIIFMVAAPMAIASIKVDLPPNKAPVTREPPKPPVFINVEQYGRVYIADREVSLATLNTEVAKALASPNPTEERLMIRANRSVKYADFMGVLNTLQGGGYFKVGLISEAL